jgi:hypothetical protein
MHAAAPCAFVSAPLAGAGEMKSVSLGEFRNSIATLAGRIRTDTLFLPAR